MFLDSLFYRRPAPRLPTHAFFDVDLRVAAQSVEAVAPEEHLDAFAGTRACAHSYHVVIVKGDIDGFGQVPLTDAPARLDIERLTVRVDLRSHKCEHR